MQYVRAPRAAGFKGPITSELASAEPEFRSFKDTELYLLLHNSLISDDKPVHKKVVAAAKQFNAKAAAGDLLDGWLVGMVIEKGLRNCGFPCSRQKLTEILNNNFSIDSQDSLDLIAGKIVWTPEVHNLKIRYFRIVHWSDQSQSFENFGDPVSIEDPGLVFPKF